MVTIFNLITALLFVLLPDSSTAASMSTASPAPRATSGLQAPKSGKIKVAFVLTEGATMIDFAGPWEVLGNVHVPDRGPTMDDVMPFELYTVSDSRDPIHTSGGMTVIPDYTFDDVPQPRVVFVPAQGGHSPKMMTWLRAMSTRADVVASVCTGAFKLAEAGLLAGKPATTHHAFYDVFSKRYPDVKLVKGRRYVQSDSVIATAGGLTSGIDLALHVVERYFGRDIAQNTADYMEYQGSGWKNPVLSAEF